MRIRFDPLPHSVGQRILHCCELWCRLQTQLQSGAAVAVVWPSCCNWELLYAMGVALRKKKKKRQKGSMDLSMEPEEDLNFSSFT